MLIDQNHRPANGAARPTLCAYHADRLRAAVPAVDPEVLAAELLADIDSFTTADEVNLFLGNLVRQLARKRIARRDAIALAYISQLILTAKPPWPDNAQSNRRVPTKRCSIASSLAFARGVANLRHSPLSNQPAPPPSSSRMTRSARRRTVAKRLIASPKSVG